MENSISKLVRISVVIFLICSLGILLNRIITNYEESLTDYRRKMNLRLSQVHEENTRISNEYEREITTCKKDYAKAAEQLKEQISAGAKKKSMSVKSDEKQQDVSEIETLWKHLEAEIEKMVVNKTTLTSIVKQLKKSIIPLQQSQAIQKIDKL